MKIPSLSLSLFVSYSSIVSNTEGFSPRISTIFGGRSKSSSSHHVQSSSTTNNNKLTMSLGGERSSKLSYSTNSEVDGILTTTKSVAEKRVYLFHEGNKSMVPTLGGKGANLAEMASMGLPVPPGFTISTKVCTDFFHHKDLPPGLKEEYVVALQEVERQIGRKFGDVHDPLLLSVRSGAAQSMPGMMDTVLNLGINNEIVQGMIATSGNPRWAYDTYRRFIQMFSDVVMGMDGELFEHALTTLKAEKGVTLDVELTAEDLKELVRRFQDINPNVPTDPLVQLEMAIQAVFQSWHNPRAARYRQYNGISAESGTAVNIQSMVFGNKNDECGTGVAFTRNPANGDNLFFGEFLINAQGEDVVAGIRTPSNLDEMKAHWPHIYNQLNDIRQLLEREYRDMQDIEFTIEDGTLFMLQTRSGKRTAKASVKVAVDMVQEGMITEKEGLLRVKPEMMDFFLHPSIDPNAAKDVIAKGLPASPGAATGMIVFNSDDAEAQAELGHQVILVRRDTTAEDIHGMKAAEGILTQLGGMTSHAAVVARGMGTTCVAGCNDIKVDTEKETLKYGDQILTRGDVITLDGTTGEVILGTVQLAEAGGDEDFQTVLGWADKYRTLKVKANADTPHDAETARSLGAEGIGLCRTEHMFFEPERITEMRKMVLADSMERRQLQLDKLFEFQKQDMVGLFDAMDGLPVTIRLLDPPLHEFLPHDDNACEMIGNVAEVRKRCEELQEVNPMMGFRGCRLSVVYPEITEMQVRAIVTAACEATKAGHVTKPEIMIPVVSTEKEISLILPMAKEVAMEVLKEQGLTQEQVPFKIGTMMELPRACLRAEAITRAGVEFMSFGTNDLTQSTFGFSRDDMGKFVPSYLAKGVLEVDPFVTIDQVGVGSLIQMTLETALPANPNLNIGICGEHGGDPKSVEFFNKLGLDYVSCSPYRVPIARIAAGQAAIKQAKE